MFPYSEPKLVNDPSIAGVLAELQAQEPIFHHPELGTSRSDFDKMMICDFWEGGGVGPEI